MKNWRSLNDRRNMKHKQKGRNSLRTNSHQISSFGAIATAIISGISKLLHHNLRNREGINRALNS